MKPRIENADKIDGGAEVIENYNSSIEIVYNEQLISRP